MFGFLKFWKREKTELDKAKEHVGAERAEYNKLVGEVIAAITESLEKDNYGSWRIHQGPVLTDMFTLKNSKMKCELGYDTSLRCLYEVKCGDLRLKDSISREAKDRMVSFIVKRIDIFLERKAQRTRKDDVKFLKGIVAKVKEEKE